MLTEDIWIYILLGAIAMASITIGVFFLRFWKDTENRFFLFFAISFLLEGAEPSCSRVGCRPK